MDTIPVLNDIVEDDLNAPGLMVDRTALFLGELEAHLTAAIHERADELVHNACREMEALLLEQVSDRLREQLPALVAGIIEEHFRGPDRVN
jgi:ribosomal protein L11 methylase PrmA